MLRILACLCIVIGAANFSWAQQMVAGGVGAMYAVNATDPEAGIISSVESVFSGMSGITPAMFQPVSCAKQVVAGTNYFCLVQTDANAYVMLRIFVPLPYTQNPPQLTNYQCGVSNSGTITYFSTNSGCPINDNTNNNQGNQASPDVSSNNFNGASQSSASHWLFVACLYGLIASL